MYFYILGFSSFLISIPKPVSLFFFPIPCNECAGDSPEQELPLKLLMFLVQLIKPDIKEVGY